MKISKILFALTISSLALGNSFDAQAQTNTHLLLDLNGDQKCDLLWQHPNGRIATWFMDGSTNGVTNIGSMMLSFTSAPSWRIVAQGDLDNDGKTDWLWHHRDGALALWRMDGTNRLGSITLAQGTAGWRVAGLSDFNDDGQTDILWHHGQGLVVVWLMDNTTNGLTASNVVVLAEGRRVASWGIVGISDFDNDGQEDLLWQNASGRLAVWYMNQTELLRSELLPHMKNGSSSWNIVACADLNGDGEEDWVWYNKRGQVAVWLMNNTDVTQAVLLNHGNPSGQGWRIVGPR